MKFVRYARTGLLCLLPPAVIATLVVGRDRVFTLLVVVTWISVLSFLPLYVRWRLLGAKVWMLVVFIAICMVALAAMTPVLVLDWMQRL
jgi:hypothetical protein